MSILASKDIHDSTSSAHAEDLKTIEKADPETVRFVVPEEALNDGLDPQIKALFLEKIEALKNAGHSVDIQSLPILKESLTIYYTLMPAEVSTNLSRFDGIRF